jgi:NAD(P)-dependent dehydrogenase (short-subunit alcohol dehydrogenase family)
VELEGISTLVTGGASGLGLASTRRLLAAGASVVIADLPGSAGEQVAAELGDRVRFAPADVRNEADIQPALDAAEEAGPLRAVIHCAGRGGAVRLVDKDGNPGSLERYADVININLIGTFNVLRLAAARMARNEPLDGDRGVCVLTASVAAFEGQIGQIPYASSKAGIVGMTIVAARDLAGKRIRVCTIAPGTFDTPLLAQLPDEVKASREDGPAPEQAGGARRVREPRAPHP